MAGYLDEEGGVMTDRELLELAARAAAIPYIIPASSHDWSLGIDVCDAFGRALYRWNPLTDDGDALRLACRLSIDVIVRTISVISGDASPGGKVVIVECAGTPEGRAVAARRAIVRAAAELT